MLIIGMGTVCQRLTKHELSMFESQVAVFWYYHRVQQLSVVQALLVSIYWSIEIFSLKFVTLIFSCLLFYPVHCAAQSL